MCGLGTMVHLSATSLTFVLSLNKPNNNNNNVCIKQLNPEKCGQLAVMPLFQPDVMVW
jgi:hypothetical protein